MEKSVTAEIEKFRKDVASSAEDIVFKVFPAKILELNERIATFSSTDPSTPFHPSHAKAHIDVCVHSSSPENEGGDEPPSKKRKTGSASAQGKTSHVQDGALSAKQHTKTLYEIVKKECEELAGLIDQVKLWVTLTIPKMEDGDSFVQEECLSELHRAQDSAYNLRDIPRQDYLARAKIASKRIKYPDVEDYELALQEHDEKQNYFCRQRIHDIRNLYAALMDVLQKNISKLRSPKGNNTAMH